MKKLIIASAFIFTLSIGLFSCKSSHGGGGCDAFGGSHSMVIHKTTGKSL